MIIDGRAIAKKRNLILKEKIANIEGDRNPKLAIILVGDNKASEVYVKHKIKKANFVGVETLVLNFKEDITREKLSSEIIKLNNDNSVDGVIVQLPLPEHLDSNYFLDLVSDEKDVDGFSVKHQGLLFQGRDTVLSATPAGILSLLKEYNIKLEGINALVIGRSLIVGRPLAQALIKENATVTIASKHTKDLKAFTKKADLIVVAAGVPYLIRKNMVKKDVTIIDVGINFIDNKTIGDCDFDNLKNKVKYITPVPGGVGPMTINALLENTYKQYLLKNKKGALK